MKVIKGSVDWEDKTITEEKAIVFDFESTNDVKALRLYFKDNEQIKKFINLLIIESVGDFPDFNYSTLPERDISKIIQCLYFVRNNMQLKVNDQVAAIEELNSLIQILNP